MADDDSGVVFLAACPSKSCCFATTEPYNFCPRCGCTLYFADQERLIGGNLHAIKHDSRCESAWRCELMGHYDERCETLEVSNRCVNSILDHIASLETMMAQRLPRLWNPASEDGKA